MYGGTASDQGHLLEVLGTAFPSGVTGEAHHLKGRKDVATGGLSLFGTAGAAAFFTMNGCVSMIFFLFWTAAIFIR